MEFACKVSGAKLIAVIGHSNCGAIKGAVDDVQLGNLTGLLAKIKPAMDAVPADVQPRTSKNSNLWMMFPKRTCVWSCNRSATAVPSCAK